MAIPWNKHLALENLGVAYKHRGREYTEDTID